jgi:hypothetical protein
MYCRLAECEVASLNAFWRKHFSQARRLSEHSGAGGENLRVALILSSEEGA